MTQTIISAEQSSETTTSPRPFGILMRLIVALLAPMFLGVTAGDVDLARMAAIETVNAYRARNHADLLAVAQIIAFGLAALGSLSLSMDDEISIPMALRLRGNANACNRSAEQNRRALQGSSGDDRATDYAAIAEEPETQATTSPDDHLPAPEADDHLPAPEAFLSPAAVQELAAEARGRLREPEQAVDRPAIPAHRSPSVATDKTAEKRHQEMWAIAMVKEAAELTASIPNLPASERSAAEIRAAALGSTAHELLTGVNWRLPPLGEPTRPAPT